MLAAGRGRAAAWARLDGEPDHQEKCYPGNDDNCQRWQQLLPQTGRASGDLLEVGRVEVLSAIRRFEPVMPEVGKVGV